MVFSYCRAQNLGSGTCTLVSDGKRRSSRSGLPCGRGTLDSEDRLTLRVNAREHQIRSYYHALFQAWGPQHWWPAQSRFEVIVGSYLTQNTAWTNVEKALANLRSAHVLSVSGIRRVSLGELERLIRPAGYFRQKAKRLKIFVAFLDKQYEGSLTKLLARPTEKLREELLNLHGVGPETADSILLYAGNHPVFVVDAYTRRIFTRHEILPEDAAYDEIRNLFERALALVAESVANSGATVNQHLAKGFPGAAHPPSAMSMAKRTGLAQVYNEMHGLIVGVGKSYCKKSQALCDECPLQKFLPLSN
jgi:endonuclease-3 related protein